MFVLILYWSFHNNPMAMHTSVYAYTYATQSSCEKVGEKWLRERRVEDIQTRHAYTCEAGNTSYMQGK